MKEFTDEQKTKMILEALKQADDPTDDASVMQALMNIRRALRDNSPELRLLDSNTVPISCIITGVKHEESSNRDIIQVHARNAADDSKVEEFRTYRLENPVGKFVSSRAKSLIQQRATIWKVLDKTRDGGKEVRIALWVERWK